MNRKICRDKDGGMIMVETKNLLDRVLINYGDVIIKNSPGKNVKEGELDIRPVFETNEEYLYAKDYNEALRSLDSSYEKMFEEALEA